MSNALTLATLRIRNFVAGRRENGQGTIEYLGMLIVAAVIVIAVIGAFDNFNVGSKMKDEFQSVVDKGHKPAGT